MKILFVYPRFLRHAESNPELRAVVPMKEYLGSPSLGIASLAALTPPEIEVEYRDDRLQDADRDTDADLVALSFFTPAATRALRLARAFRARGKAVVAGGIFPTLMPEEVQPHVDALVLGEGEPVWPTLLQDFARGALRPRYGPIVHELERAAAPKVELYIDAERGDVQPDDYPLQLSRGCPWRCEACALPGTMGARLRTFPLEQILEQLARLEARGKRACLTEDTGWFTSTSAGRRLGQLFDHLAERGQEMAISYVGISMPMILAAGDRWLQRARRAGVRMFYLVGGFDPITRRAFTGQDPAALRRAHEAIARCQAHGIEPYTSFLLGQDEDDPGTVDRMLAFAADSSIRKAEFALFTPYPGTPAWRRLSQQGRILSRRWEHYNDAHVVFKPARFGVEELREGYLRLWREFYAAQPPAAEWTESERTIQF